MIKNTRFLIVCILLILAGLYINLHSDVEVPLNKSFKEFPIEYKGWHMTSESQFSADVLEVLKPTDYIYRRYVGAEGVPVYLYIGYHGGGKESGPIHSPKNCLPGSGWFELTEEIINIDVGSKTLELVKTVYQKGIDKELFLYWFEVGGKSVSNEFELKFTLIENSILYRRRDSAFIRVSVDIESDEDLAFLAGEKFIKDIHPVIEEFLPE